MYGGSEFSIFLLNYFKLMYLKNIKNNLKLTKCTSKHLSRSRFQLIVLLFWKQDPGEVGIADLPDEMK